MTEDKPSLDKERDALEVQVDRVTRLLDSLEALRAENEELKDHAVLIRCRSLSTQSERERGYHKYLTTITGYQADFYAPIEFEKEKKQSMWCSMEQKGKNHYEIRHGYDSGD